ncbi:hypothetical protein AYI69_g9918, partial [Smittium culicis]
MQAYIKFFSNIILISLLVASCFSNPQVNQGLTEIPWIGIYNSLEGIEGVEIFKCWIKQVAFGDPGIYRSCINNDSNAGYLGYFSKFYRNSNYQSFKSSLKNFRAFGNPELKNSPKKLDYQAIFTLLAPKNSAIEREISKNIDQLGGGLCLIPFKKQLDICGRNFIDNVYGIKIAAGEAQNIVGGC